MNIEEINPDVHFHKSLEFLRLSNYQSAIKCIDLAITKSINKNFYMFQKIKILFVAKMFNQCSHYIVDNLKILYKNSSLYIFSQILYYYQTTSSCSIFDLENLLFLNDIPSVLANEFSFFIDNQNINLLEEIISLKKTNNYVKCIDYCDLLLSKDMHNVTTYLTKARCHCLIGEHNLGIRTYKKLLAIVANVPSIYNEIGLAMLKAQDYPNAISYFQHAIELEPSNVCFISQLAESFYLWKKYDSALIYFKKVLLITPDCTETLLRIADLYELTNKSKKAKKYYNKAINCSIINK